MFSPPRSTTRSGRQPTLCLEPTASQAWAWQAVVSRRLMVLLAIFSQAALLSQTVLAQKASSDPLAAYRTAAEKWEKDIQALEKLDKSQPSDERTILFLGSSSIKRWTTLTADLAPWPALNRGYGGARFSDLAIYAPRLLQAHQPRAAVIYVGNDITGKQDTDKRPEEVVQLFRTVVESIRQRNPLAEIFLVEITPAPSRFQAWPQIQAANRELKAACEADDHLHFIETHPHYLTAAGQPRPELFVSDRLHQNEDGYQVWKRLIMAQVEAVLVKP
jgi:lysophospholipase L1-like esterase